MGCGLLHLDSLVFNTTHLNVILIFPQASATFAWSTLCPHTGTVSPLICQFPKEKVFISTEDKHPPDIPNCYFYVPHYFSYTSEILTLTVCHLLQQQLKMLREESPKRAFGSIGHKHHNFPRQNFNQNT